MAELIIRQGYVLEVSNVHRKSKFQQAFRQLEELQKEVGEFAEELLEAQAAQRKARDMTEVSRQLKHEGLRKESDSAFISTKARIGQIQTEIVEVMKERRQKERVTIAPAYQECYDWLRQTRDSNINHKKARLCA